MDPVKLQLKQQLQPFAALSDAEVVDRVLAGDEPLFELLMRRYNGRLFRIARGVLKRDDLSEDAIQEAYISAYGHLSQFQGPQGFGAWLAQIAYRAALKISRNEQQLSDQERVEPDSLTTLQEQPELRAEGAETMALVQAAIDALPSDFRLVFNLRVLENLSTAETAVILGLNPTTVKTRLFRSKGLLRARLGRRYRDVREQALPFAGQRCDAIVARVFRRLHPLP